jgi:hypothetical protein
MRLDLLLQEWVFIKQVCFPRLSLASFLHIPTCFSVFCHQMKQTMAPNRGSHYILDFPASRNMSENEPLFFINYPVSGILLQQQNVD